jgi:signal transduction histidine kinase/PAS domain-containing protein
LVKAFPDFGMSGLLCILAVALVAISWGAGASLVATVAGALLLNFVVLMAVPGWLDHPSRTAAEFGVFLAVGIIITIGASQVERARRAAEQLAASLAQASARGEVERNRVRAVLDVLPVGVLIADAAGNVVEANAAGRAVWGERDPSVTAAVPTRSLRGWCPDTGQPLRTDEWPLLRAVTLGEVTTGREIEIEAFNGERKTVLQSATPIRDDQGRIVGGVVALVDITERKRLESRTRDTLDALLRMAETMVLATEWGDAAEGAAPGGSRNLMRRLAELTRSVVGCQRVTMVAVTADGDQCVPIAVVGMDRQHETQWWLDWEQRAHRLSDHLMPAHLAALRQGEMVALDATQAPDAGQTNPFGSHQLLLAPLSLPHALVGLLAFDDDSAENVATPERRTLAGATARLATLVIERERLEFERAQAQASEMALLEANRRMDDFLAVASHEFKNPLQGVKSNIQLLARRLTVEAERPSPPRDLERVVASTQPLFQRINSQVRRLTRLVDDLLDVARIRADMLELRLTPCDLRAIVTEAVENERIFWAERAIELEVPPELVPVVADADRIGQVVTNFLTNALKYSAEDQPVWVALRVEGAQACVTVRDAGPGLPLEEQELIWQRFHRAPGVEVLSGAGKGLGLGLHISRTIVERHDGKVGVVSAPGEGSTFWLTLSLAAPGEA